MTNETLPEVNQLSTEALIALNQAVVAELKRRNPPSHVTAIPKRRASDIIMPDQQRTDEFLAALDRLASTTPLPSVNGRWQQGQEIGRGVRGPSEAVISELELIHDGKGNMIKPRKRRSPTLDRVLNFFGAGLDPDVVTKDVTPKGTPLTEEDLDYTLPGKVLILNKQAEANLRGEHAERLYRFTVHSRTSWDQNGLGHMAHVLKVINFAGQEYSFCTGKSSLGYTSCPWIDLKDLAIDESFPQLPVTPA